MNTERNAAEDMKAMKKKIRDDISMAKKAKNEVLVEALKKQLHLLENSPDRLAHDVSYLKHFRNLIHNLRIVLWDSVVCGTARRAQNIATGVVSGVKGLCLELFGWIEDLIHDLGSAVVSA